MAKTSLKVKAARKPKFKVRGYTRCQRCGRPHSVYQKFGICRICFREMAHRGEPFRGSTHGRYQTSDKQRADVRNAGNVYNREP